MTGNIDRRTIKRLHLVGTRTLYHSNGKVIVAGGYAGFKGRTLSGAPKVFLKLNPADLDIDAIDVTKDVDNFIASEG